MDGPLLESPPLLVKTGITAEITDPLPHDLAEVFGRLVAALDEAILAGSIQTPTATRVSGRAGRSKRNPLVRVVGDPLMRRRLR
jgi:hypothetical protein